MTDKAVRTPPKGIRKGGARFPRYSLKDALPWAKKLVSKTHLEAVPQDIVFAGVVGSKSTTGEIKVSALKQFDLLEGTSKAYKATELARSITNAPDEDQPALLSRAALAPDVFKALFQTFHDDEVSVAKLRHRAADLNVHPDETERCIKLYIASLETAGLVQIAGDQVRHRSQAPITSTEAQESERTVDGDTDQIAETTVELQAPEQPLENEDHPEQGPRPRAVFNVSVNLDSSLDTEKLERQLQLLKRYGAI